MGGPYTHTIGTTLETQSQYRRVYSYLVDHGRHKMTKKQKKTSLKISKMLISALGGFFIAGLIGIVILRSFFPSIYYEVKDVMLKLVNYDFQSVSVGQPAPDFTTQNLNGQTVKLSQFLGQTVILTLSKTWCLDCKKQIPLLNQTYETHTGLVILDVDIKEPESLVRKYAEETRITYPVLLDEQGEIKKLYQVSGYPTNFIIDSEGIIRFKIIGEITEEGLKQALQIVGESN
jgi:peroxiredoxin